MPPLTEGPDSAPGQISFSPVTSGSFETEPPHLTSILPILQLQAPGTDFAWWTHL